MKISKKRSLGYILMSLCTAALTAGGLWLYFTQQTKRSEGPAIQTSQQPNDKKPDEKHSIEKQPDPAKPAPKPKPEVVTITLPGAAPFAARIENYHADDSIWKIVNKQGGFQHPQYRPRDLQVVSVPTKAGRGQDERSVRGVVMADLRRLSAAAQAAGVDVRVGSGYRSYATQSVLYNSYVRQHGKAAADRFSARPGTSEHQSGLVIDFDSEGGRCWVDTCFESLAAGRWLAAHAHEYGFHLRYQKDKEAVTGFMYEPWHFRYVGVELARALHQSGLALEEAKPYLDTALATLRQQGKV
ncbi:MAG: M15 family metallopeptidase [Candidatus Saccharibacteria bacterium]|nr:M15 family metallopeptidase [Candidatus Saccharibacteria bacterium]